MKQVVPGVYTFTGLPVGRVYLLEGDDGLTIIDASVKAAGPKILRQLRESSYDSAKLQRILVTHAHPDHVGALAELERETGAEIWISEPERPVLEGRISVPLPPKTSLSFIARHVPLPDTRFEGLEAGRILKDGEHLDEILGGLEVVSSPGHAHGHLAFFQRQRRILFCGDVILHLFSRLSLPFSFATVDMEENRRSIRKLVDLEPEVVCFGHGPPIVVGAGARLRAFADRVC